MPAESKPNVFISYARADDESFVERLHNDLETRGIRVWWDRQSMSNRGLTFLDEIQRAIESVDRVIAAVGPNALKSKYVLYEWDYALLFGKAVVPILCLGDYASIPGNLTRDIRNYHCPDFRVERPYNQALDELERIVREPVAPFGPVRATPALPPGFLPRRDAMNAMWEVLYADIERPKPVASAAEQTLVLHGMGGSGKSVLAAAFARSIDTRHAANDGIVWLKAGRDTKPGDRLANLWLLGLTFNDDPKYYADEKPARGRLSQLLADKGCVIVLDDVWSKDDAEPYLNALGPRCRLLVTTRDAGLAVLGRSQALDVLDDDQALELLARSSGHAVDVLPTAAKEVAKECGNLPLALAMIGAMVSGNPDRWEHALHRLRTLKLDKIQFSIPNYDYTNLLLAIQVSIDDLKQDQQARYLELAVFPPGISVPEDTLRVLWEPTGVDPYDATDLIDLFVRRSLARTFAKGTILLHDLQSDYVRARTANQVALNGRLLDAYAKRCSNGWASGPKDGYYFEHLPWHLKEAGRTSELKQLLLNFEWLQAKLTATDPSALIADYDFLLSEPCLHLVRDAIRLSAHVLVRDRRHLASQLTGRLLGIVDDDIQALLKQAAEKAPRPWLRPLRRSLSSPIDPLERTLIGHSNVVNGIALTPDGEKAVSVAEDGVLKVWDLDDESEIHSLSADKRAITCIAVSPNGRHAISGGWDYALSLWDILNGTLRGVQIAANKAIYAVTVTPDGQIALAGSLDGHVNAFDMAHGSYLGFLTAAGQVWSVAVTHDGKRVLTGGTGNIKVMDLSGNELISLPTTTVTSALAITQDDTRVVAAGHDHVLTVWNLDDGAALLTLRGHTGIVNAVTITPDDRKVISASDDKTLKVWDLTTGHEITTLFGHYAPVKTVTVTPDGRHILSGSADNTIRIWDITKVRLTRSFLQHTEQVNVVVVSPDGQWALSGGDDEIVIAWDLNTGTALRSLRHIPEGNGLRCMVHGLVTMTDNRRVISLCANYRLCVWDFHSGSELTRSYGGYPAYSTAHAITPDGKYLLLSCLQYTLDTITILDAETLHEIRQLRGHGKKIRTITVTPDSKHAVTATEDMSITVWDLNTATELYYLPFPQKGENGIVSITFDGSRAIIITRIQEETTLMVWDLAPASMPRSLTSFTDHVAALCVTPDAQLVVCCSDDGKVTVRDLEQGGVRATFVTDSPIRSCVVSPNGKTIVVGDQLGHVLFFQME